MPSTYRDLKPSHAPNSPEPSLSTLFNTDPPPGPSDANGSLPLLSDPVRTATLRALRLTPDRRNNPNVVDRLANAREFEFSSVENASRKLLEHAKNLLRDFPDPSLVEACLLSQFQLAMSRLVQHFEYLALADVVPLDRDELRAYASAQRDFFRAAQALQRRLDYRERAANPTLAQRASRYKPDRLGPARPVDPPRSTEPAPIPIPNATTIRFPSSHANEYPEEPTLAPASAKNSVSPPSSDVSSTRNHTQVTENSRLTAIREALAPSGDYSWLPISATPPPRNGHKHTGQNPLDHDPFEPENQPPSGRMIAS